MRLPWVHAAILGLAWDTVGLLWDCHGVMSLTLNCRSFMGPSWDTMELIRRPSDCHGTTMGLWDSDLTDLGLPRFMPYHGVHITRLTGYHVTRMESHN